MVNNKQVVQYLITVSFPATKEELVRDASGTEPEDVLKALRAMPPVEYANKAEMQRSTLRTAVEPE